MERNIDTVIEQICEILITYCNEKDTINNWKKEFEWYIEMDKNRNTKYFNLAPEYIKLIKWQKLSNIMNMFIVYDGEHNIWEQKIIDIFLNKEVSNTIIHPYIDNDEMK